MGTSSSIVYGSATKKMSEELLETRKFYHSLARSLEGGASTRPGFPVELVIHILRLANCVLPLRVSSKAGRSVRAKAAEKAYSPWFSVPPLKREFIRRGLSMQLTTVSQDQGWCSNRSAGSWSWFEIAIVSMNDGDVKRRDNDGSALEWISHSNAIAGHRWSTVEGVVFNKDHEMWQHLDDEHILQVQVCAQYFGWENNAQEGFLDIVETFEPTLPPRASD